MLVVVDYDLKADPSVGATDRSAVEALLLQARGGANNRAIGDAAIEALSRGLKVSFRMQGDRLLVELSR